MRRIIAQSRKELIQITRDRLAIILALVLPLCLLLLLGTAISLTVTGLPIVVQDLDNSAESRSFTDAFRASNTFYVAPWPATVSPANAFKQNKARAVLIIPEHFSRDLTRGRNTETQLLVDATDANTAKLIQGYSAQIVAAWNSLNTPRATAVRSEIRLWYNPGRESKKFYGPGIFVLGISMFPPLLAALAMSKEGEQKTILQVYVSSISAHEFLLGKIFAFTTIALAEVSLMMVLLYTYFGLHIAGDPTPLLVATVLYAFTVSTFGTMIGAAIPSQAAAIQAVSLGGFLLVFLLSGLIFPVQNIPAGLRWVSAIVWGRYYIEIVRDGPPAGRRLARHVVQRPHDRLHRLSLLLPLLETHAEDAAQRMNIIRSVFGPVLPALMRKEFNQIRRDRRLAISLIVPPTLQLLLFGFALNATIEHLHLGIVDLDPSVQSRDLIANMTESQAFRGGGAYLSLKTSVSLCLVAKSMPVSSSPPTLRRTLRAIAPPRSRFCSTP